MFTNTKPANNRESKKFRAVGGAAAVLLAGGLAALTMSGCEPVGAGATAKADHHEDQHQSYDHAVERIELDLDGGNITLSPGTSSAVNIDRTLSWNNTKPTVTERWDGKTLRISSRCAKQEQNCATDYRIGAPAGVTVTAKTDAGDISTRGINGAQELRSSAGDLTIEGSQGRLNLFTDSGQINGTGLHSGQVEAKTNAGKVNLTLAVVPDSLTAKSSAGNIDLQVPRAGGGASGYNVQARTNAGRKQVNVDSAADGKHRIVAETDSGDIQVRYAS